jgi:hypothetical protein
MWRRENSWPYWDSNSNPWSPNPWPLYTNYTIPARKTRHCSKNKTISTRVASSRLGITLMLKSSWSPSFTYVLLASFCYKGRSKHLHQWHVPTDTRIFFAVNGFSCTQVLRNGSEVVCSIFHNLSFKERTFSLRTCKYCCEMQSWRNEANI